MGFCTTVRRCDRLGGLPNDQRVHDDRRRGLVGLAHTVQRHAELHGLRWSRAALLPPRAIPVVPGVRWPLVSRLLRLPAIAITCVHDDRAREWSVHAGREQWSKRAGVDVLRFDGRDYER